jgi:hypothetical protein
MPKNAAGNFSRGGHIVADSPNPEKKDQQFQGVVEALSRNESPAFKVAHAEWVACNEITDKFVYRGAAIGWTMKPEDRGWFGRVGKEEMSFGPTSRRRARLAVEAFLKREPFDKLEDERSWSGSCWRLLGGSPQAKELVDA